jgi:hypothetical protein
LIAVVEQPATSVLAVRNREQWKQVQSQYLLP